MREDGRGIDRRTERRKIKEIGTYFIQRDVEAYAKYFKYLPEIGRIDDTDV